MWISLLNRWMPDGFVRRRRSSIRVLGEVVDTANKCG
jgi:hypothetical protein